MRVVLFDVDGVLIHGYHARPELRQCWDENMEADLGISRDSFKRDFIYGVFIQEVLTGRQDLKIALADVLPGLGYTDNPQRVIDYWLKNDSKINRPLLEHIQTLHASGKVRLYIATNQEHNRAAYLMNELGFGQYFKDIYHSARIGHIKPDTSYFEGITKKLGDISDPPIFFDDTPEVVNAAKAYGWEAYEFADINDLYKNRFIKDILTGN